MFEERNATLIIITVYLLHAYIELEWLEGFSADVHAKLDGCSGWLSQESKDKYSTYVEKHTGHELGHEVAVVAIQVMPRWRRMS
jgi:hypothetical protein